MILTLASSVTKRISKAIVPNFLRWSLRIHESLSSTSSLLSPNSFSMLPLACRLVSIEVQDDYYQLMSSKLKGQINIDRSITGQISSAWENFVDQTWDVLFESRHQKLKADQQQTKQEELDVVRRNRRLQQHQHRKHITREETRDNKSSDYTELANQRVRLLEEYVRPALLPTGSEQDLMRNLFTTQQQNDIQSSTYDYFVKWIRGEYLIAKYGLAVQQAVKEHPTLRDDVANLNSVGGTQSLDGEEVEVPLTLLLPKLDTIIRAFDMEDWSREKVPVSSWDDDVEDTNINSQADLSIKDVIHNKLQGQIHFSGPLNAYFEMRRREDSYELWNYDYIFALAQYLIDRITALDSVKSTPLHTTILDVGAGDGRLIYFLRRAMNQIVVTNSSASSIISLHRKNGKTKRAIESMEVKSQTFKLPILIATDDGSWNAPIYKNQHIAVEKLSAVEAVAKYAPPPPEQKSEVGSSRIIVLCSWMPSGQDWTGDFRKPSSSLFAPGELGGEGIVEEYILIGECDDGTCGDNWLTWGNADAYECEDGNKKPVRVAPYAEDGYERVDLEELSRLQVSRFDCKRSSESKTVSFRRTGDRLSQ